MGEVAGPRELPPYLAPWVDDEQPFVVVGDPHVGGSAYGSEPGASRPCSAAAASHGATLAAGIACGTSRNVVTAGTGRVPSSPPIR